MFDVALVEEILRQILWSARTIANRFEPITSTDEFLDSEEGLEKLDAICMQLIAIGESVKNLDRVTDGRLLVCYPEIEWKRIMGMRDVSHHYFGVDAEIVFSVCQRHIEPLAQTVRKILADIQSSG
jgi:uncharacterized protein with HEPN domain